MSEFLSMHFYIFLYCVLRQDLSMWPRLPYGPGSTETDDSAASAFWMLWLQAGLDTDTASLSFFKLTFAYAAVGKVQKRMAL